jgi:purine-binding chemotaxis protein CheW
MLDMPDTARGRQIMANEAGGSAERQLVVFRLAQDVYGFEIQAVREIIRMQEITRVPNAPEFIEGVINLRGRICPVMDLRKRFGISISDATAESRIVVVEIAGEDVGMIVDAVTEVLRVAGDRIQPPSSVVKTADTRVVEGIVNLDNRLIILVDLNTLLADGDQAVFGGSEALAAA